MTKRPENNRYLSDEDDDESYEQPKEKGKERPPRFVKNGIEGVNPQEIVVNLSKTHYDVIEIVVEELGWVVERSKKSQKWDIMWTDFHIQAEDLFKLNDHQKISHFPAIQVLSKKNFLGRSLMKMAKSFPKQYSFFPPTWSVPSEMGELMRFDSQHDDNYKTIYIFKPEAGCQGKGISLISSLQQIQGRTGIVQTYINSPFLIDGLKFDMRLYVLIYGTDPTRIYIYEEGLARFATQPYEKAKKKNLKETFVHLTNYAINKNNKKFIFNTSEKSMHVGHKRSLTSIFNLLKTRGVDINLVQAKIDSLIVKTLLVGKPMLNHLYGLSQTDNLANDHCFHILGFDVMLDEHLEPLLLEVNHTPSFATDTPLDKSIKKGLIKETFLLLNVNIQTKKTKIDKKKQFDQKRAMRKLVKLTPEERFQQKKVIEKEKNAHQAVTLKRYRKLYPLQSTNEYGEFQECSQKIFNEHYGFKNKETKDQRQLSPIKNISKQRPASLSQIASTTMMRKVAFNPMGNPSSTLASAEKLPGIVLKRGVSDKNQTITPQKPVKNYEFNPETIFSQFKEKINNHNIYIKQRIANIQNSQQDTLFVERERIRKDGGFVEPKTLHLSESLSKPSPMFDDSSIQASHLKLPKSQIKKHKNYMDFLSLSNRQKNSNIIPNEKSPVLLQKIQSNRKNISTRMPSKQFALSGVREVQGDYLLLRSMIFSKQINMT